MKSKLLILLVGFTVLLSCSKESDLELFQKNNAEDALDSREEPIPGAEICTQVDLMAGQHYDSGNVEVAIDGENLLVTYTMEGDWVLNATHLFVGECSERPANKSGNPKIGHFPYAATHAQGTTSYTYSIPIASLPNCLCIAAHAEVSGPSGNETAWGAGLPYGGNSWAMYFEYCLDQCGS
ncbi:hypothetical protein A7A78_07875 [Aequorivita soesokkakensis]|jgi:hypothetical protein|uniref:Uncharacterized protein n=2 Tax=Aequorivita soesokkakensis TaxID=1385699 RepID=A0A1A9LAN0_9FLAO|nr:hypothetical protein A7A78_07875 [Aequorivita soesokkakensis]